MENPQKINIKEIFEHILNFGSKYLISSKQFASYRKLFFVFNEMPPLEQYPKKFVFGHVQIPFC
jgi:hypothetical protein